MSDRAAQPTAQTEARAWKQRKSVGNRKIDAELLDSEINAFKSKNGTVRAVVKNRKRELFKSWEDPFLGALIGIDKFELAVPREALPGTTTPLLKIGLCMKPNV